MFLGLHPVAFQFSHDFGQKIGYRVRCWTTTLQVIFDLYWIFTPHGISKLNNAPMLTLGSVPLVLCRTIIPGCETKSGRSLPDCQRYIDASIVTLGAKLDHLTIRKRQCRFVRWRIGSVVTKGQIYNTCDIQPHNH